MARRGENIHKRKDGRWEGRYIKARTPEGKIQWGYIYGTAYAEVKRVLIQKKAEAGFYNLKRTDLTFEALAEVWLHSLRNSIKESTYGLALMFADYFKQIARYNSERKGWYVYDGSVWRPDKGNLKVSELAKLLADKLYAEH